MNADRVAFDNLWHGELQNTVLQGRGHLIRVDIRRQTYDAQDLVGAALRVDRLALFLFLLGLSFAGNRKLAWLDAYFEFFFVETGHFGLHRKRVIRLLDAHVDGVNDFPLGLEPVLKVAPECPAATFEDFIGSA